MSLFNKFNFDRLKSGLTKTRDSLIQKISETVSRKAELDQDSLEQLEEILISSDIGYKITDRVIESARKNLLKESDRSLFKIKEVIKIELQNIFYNSASNSNGSEGNFKKPFVILIIGVNGSGKTTSIGKLSFLYKNLGYKVIVGAADTFRAAANDQLEIWAKRAGVALISGKSNDPSAVAFDTIKEALSSNADVVLIDTAGRLHTQKNLMDELNKIKKVISNLIPHAPNEIFLVVDGNSGQNALRQVEEFEKIAPITGLIVTKLDGTAKGGIVFNICSERSIPIKYIGVGESIEDFQEFDAKLFTEALLG